MLTVHSDAYFMQQALLQADLADQQLEIPIGAVIVCENKIVAKAYNQVEKLQDVTAHAEMLAITAAQNYLSSKYLDNCTMYVTLEPCTMCSGALFLSRMGALFIGARDSKRGFSLLNPVPFHPKTKVSFGILEADCEAKIKEFFKKMRNKQKE
ncbi:MAG: tRNA-specific adenosine deaminase [Flammeovirgaceae bacterium]|nr:tRNA-specific adenosine deaminase [Flammeovirgaceae bacterium]|tara:strand:+ start:1082 stop:1540 length:459 start_codon:yes stop_codon:yes gene_type:complete